MPDVLAALLRRRAWSLWPAAAPAVRNPAFRIAPCAPVSVPAVQSAMTGATVISTARLDLRELTVRDAPFVLELLNDPTFLRYIGDRGVRNLDEAHRYIVKGMLQSYERHGFGLWMVELRDDARRPIGLCGLVAREGLPLPDIGFALLPRWWSQGYAHEAATAVMAHARQALGLQRVLAIASPQNASSVRLLRKLGFAYERDVQMPGEAQPAALFVADAPT